MEDTPKTIFVFVDGLGMGERDARVNPVYSGGCPFLCEMLEQHSVPIDACLGVSGVPQSATGQTALLTGINAPERIGRHVEGFPTVALRELIREDNIFLRLKQRGYACSFANAFWLDSLEGVRRPMKYSVTTVATLSGVGWVRTKDRLAVNEAVYHDLTREALRARGYTGALIAPEEAAKHLMKIARQEDFTLFEFFQTDIQGHRGGAEDVDLVLRKLDAFLSALWSWTKEHRSLLVLTSDHGNIEDRRQRSHSRNSVPFVAAGWASDPLKRSVKRLTDVVPALLELYP